MTDGRLEAALRLGGLLIAAGLLVQLGSFFWNHPLAFIAFAVVGGGLLLVGLALFARAVFRARSWTDEVRPGLSPDAGGRG
jgi:hypothetical protein